MALDEELDERDPTPCIYELFNDYNRIYFESQLGAVAVEWSSNRMTLCGGTTQYLPGGGALIKLSKVRQKLAPHLLFLFLLYTMGFELLSLLF